MLETVAWYALTLVVRVLDKGREIERERWADEKTERTVFARRITSRLLRESVLLVYFRASRAFMIRLKIEIPIAVLGIDEIILFLYVFEYFFVSNSNSLNAN